MSLSSRLTHWINTHRPSVAQSATRKQVEKYRSSNGKKGATLMGRPCFLLEVVGRKSGELRFVMLFHVPRGDDLIVIGSAAGASTTPNWYRNVMAAERSTVQVGWQRWEVVARELPEGPEREACWKLAVAAYPGYDAYQTYTERRIPVAVLERV